MDRFPPFPPFPPLPPERPERRRPTGQQLGTPSSNRTLANAFTGVADRREELSRPDIRPENLDWEAMRQEIDRKLVDPIWDTYHQDNHHDDQYFAGIYGGEGWVPADSASPAVDYNPYDPYDPGDISGMQTMPNLGRGRKRLITSTSYPDSYDLRNPPDQSSSSMGRITNKNPTITTTSMFPLLNLSQTEQLLRGNLSIPMNSADVALRFVQENARHLPDRSRIVGGLPTADLVMIAETFPAAMAAFSWTVELDTDARVYGFVSHPFSFLPGDKIILKILGMYFSPGSWLDYLSLDGIFRICFTRHSYAEVPAQIFFPVDVDSK